MDRIVVGIDESEGSQRALEWALAEARLREAEVRLVYAMALPHMYYPYPSAVEAPYIAADQDEVEQDARELLSAALAKAGGAPAGVNVELVPKFGAPAEALVSEAEGAAMLVVGSRGRGGFAGLLLGSVSQQTVQHARCPVVVIPAER